MPQMPLRVSALRGLGAYINVFSIESFMDELADAAKADPVEFRLKHLTTRARATSSTRSSGSLAGRRTASGRADAAMASPSRSTKIWQPIAPSHSKLEVEHESGEVRLGRVVSAVDSGQAVNPDGIRNQIEGAIVQSASWTLYER